MRRRMCLFALLPLLAAAPAAAQSEAGFRDWMAFCDNLLTCSAYGVQPEGELDGAFLRVTRGPGAADAPSVTIYPPGDWPTALAYSLLIDGKPAAGALAGNLPV